MISLSVWPALLLLGAPGGTVKLDVKDTLIGLLGDGHGQVSASPDCRRAAWMEKKGDKCVAMVDDVPSKQYDRIPGFWTIATVPTDTNGGPRRTYFVFSENGKHVLYVAQRDGKKMVVADGVEGALYEDIYDPVFSSDGARMTYSAEKDGKWREVIDGEEGPVFDWAGGLLFSPDGRHMVYYGAKGDQSHILIDGVVGPPFGGGSDCAFSPDSRHLAYSMKVDEAAYIVVDGRRGKRYHSVLRPFWSPDSSKLAYVASDGKKDFVVVNGVEQKKHRSIFYGLIGFTADSTDVCYLATDTEDKLVVGKREYGSESVPNVCDEIVSRKGLAGAAEKDRKEIVCTPEAPDSTLGRSMLVCFTDGGKHYVYAGKDGDVWRASASPWGKTPETVREVVLDLAGNILSYTSRRDKTYVTWQGREFGPFDTDASVTVAPGYKHAVWVAQEAGSWHLFWDGVRCPEFDRYLPATFLPGYLGRWVVFDGPTRFHTLADRGGAIYRTEVEIVDGK